MGFAVVDFADEAGAAVVVSGASDNSGLGEAEGTVADVSVDEVLDGFEDADWLRARGEKQTRMAAASTKRFMVTESLREYRKIKATIYIDKDATRTMGVNRPR